MVLIINGQHKGQLWGVQTKLLTNAIGPTDDKLAISTLSLSSSPPSVPILFKFLGAFRTGFGIPIIA
jgi:hypothetical protein